MFPRTPGGDTNGFLGRPICGGLADCLRQKKNPRLLPGAPAVCIAVNGFRKKAPGDGSVLVAVLGLDLLLLLDDRAPRLRR